MSALIQVLLSTQSLQLRPGERGQVTITVRNMREVVDRYEILVGELDPSWVTLSRADLALFPKEQDQVLLTLNLPEGAPAGRRRVEVRVTSLDNPAERTTAEIELEIVAQHALAVTLRPQRQTGVLEGVFRVLLHNTGNAPLTVQLEATDPEEGGLYTFEPSQVLVAAGQEATVQLQVRPRLALAREQAKSYPFVVTARPLEAPKSTRQVTGEWVQTPPPVDLTLSPQRHSSVKEGSFTVQVSNRGNTDLTVRLQAGDAAQRCLYLLNPESLVVLAGQQCSAQLRVRARAGLVQGQSQTTLFTVSAQVVEVPGITRQAQGEWEQVPPTLELSLRRPQQEGTARDIFVVQLGNPGDADLTVNLQAADSQGGVYSFDSPRVVVPAGQQRHVGLSVRSSLPPDSKQVRKFSFSVTARVAESPSLVRQAQGEWEQAAQPPRAAPSAPVARPAAAAPAAGPRPRIALAIAVLLGGLAISALVGLAMAFIVAGVLAEQGAYGLSDVLAPLSIALFGLLGLVLTVVLARKVWTRKKLGGGPVLALVAYIATPIVLWVLLRLAGLIR